MFKTYHKQLNKCLLELNVNLTAKLLKTTLKYIEVSQESYSIWLSFMVHMYKKIISQGLFYIFFKILTFQVVRWVTVKIMVQNVKTLSAVLDISGTIHRITAIYGTYLKNSIFRFILKGKKPVQNNKHFCHVIIIYGAYV